METTGCGFHIVNIWLVHLTRSLISLVNDNHLDSNLKEILVYVYLGSISTQKLYRVSGKQSKTRLDVAFCGI